MQNCQLSNQFFGSKKEWKMSFLRCPAVLSWPLSHRLQPHHPASPHYSGWIFCNSIFSKGVWGCWYALSHEDFALIFCMFFLLVYLFVCCTFVLIATIPCHHLIRGESFVFSKSVIFYPSKKCILCLFIILHVYFISYDLKYQPSAHRADMFKCTVNRTFDRANPDYGNKRCQFFSRVHRTLFWTNQHY